jgi:hypothetical protein
MGRRPGPSGIFAARTVLKRGASARRQLYMVGDAYNQIDDNVKWMRIAEESFRESCLFIRLKLARTASVRNKASRIFFSYE